MRGGGMVRLGVVALDGTKIEANAAAAATTLTPVFEQVKTVQGGGRFMRRGLQACAAEWKLLCGTHNLLKLWRNTRSTTS